MKVVCISFFIWLVIALSTITPLAAQRHRAICDLEIVDAVTQEIAGRNIGFMLQIRNNNPKTFDALEYKVIYQDGFGEKVGEKQFKWQSGNFIGPIKTGETLEDVRANWVKGANKIQVILQRVHFTDDSICK
jgi:hypothetical protein